ncbi:MAG TPA: glycosyltransferase [Pirellulales bacterium]|nr:glycosyltransferase [Pirellulales bacterium]
MRRVLIVSPHFPPTNAADMHRVRISLPFYQDFGWDPEVLAVDAAYVEGTREPALLETVPEGVPMHRVRALPARLARKVGFSALGLRAFPFLYRQGLRVIRLRKPDLIFFSTTMFPVMPLGRLWKRRFGVPFVLDMQDPWVTDYYDRNPGAPRLPKHRLAQRMHKMLEHWTMRDVDGLLAVSETYHHALRERYPWIPESACHTLPFGAPASDFEIAGRADSSTKLFNAGDGLWHGVYAGRLGADMRLVCHAICKALVAGLQENPSLFGRVRLHFVGTDYAVGAAAKATIQPIADSMGLGEVISEQPGRLPYMEVLRLLKAADFLLVPGSDDPAYTASKLYPYILARKPLLAVFHQASSVVQVVRSTAAGDVVTFDSADTHCEIAARLLPVWKALLTWLPFRPPTNWRAFEPYTAREMTRQQCEFFDRVLQRRIHNHRSNGVLRETA